MKKNMDKNTELYKETNNKFVERTENMLYGICGLSKERAYEILIECLKRNDKRK
jgi:N-acetylmuramic acid 6-phosphate (MurNAc-6-P) etherase